MKPTGPSSAAISSSRGLAEVGAERVAQLDLVEAVVAAHQDAGRMPRSSTITGSALISAPGGDAERAGDLLDRASGPGVATSSGASSAGGSSTGCGSAEATSTLAA